MSGIFSALTEGELKIMELLWERGSLSSWEISFGLSKNNPVSEGMVRTVMRVLIDKGYARMETSGGVTKYEAAIDPHDARTQVLRYLLRRYFNDSPELLVEHLLSDEGLDPGTRRQLTEAFSYQVA